MKRLIILGTGGNCLDILDALLATNQHSGRIAYECAGFLDDNPAVHGQEFGGVPVLGPLTAAPRFLDCVFVVLYVFGYTHDGLPAEKILVGFLVLHFIIQVKHSQTENTESGFEAAVLVGQASCLSIKK